VRRAIATLGVALVLGAAGSAGATGPGAGGAIAFDEIFGRRQRS
jgi:hypothetical protein